MGSTRVLRLTVAAATVAVVSAVVGVAVAAQTGASKAVTGPQPGTYAGKAFDACTAPSGAQMTAWLKSPYRAIVVYIGGNNRGCKQPNLTAAWVKAQNAAGWRLIPVYVG